MLTGHELSSISRSTPSPVFLGTKLVSVWHTGRELSDGTKPLGALPAEIRSLTTSDSGAVVSLLEKADNYYLAVVNKDFRGEMQLKAEGECGSDTFA